MNNAKKKTTELERLEISSRKSDTKETFHAKMGTIKDRNGMDLTQVEDIKKRWRRRQWHPTPVLLPGKSHGWRSLVGCSP